MEIHSLVKAYLLTQVFTPIADLHLPVRPLDRLFSAERNQDADHDGPDFLKQLAPAAPGLGFVDVHGAALKLDRMVSGLADGPLWLESRHCVQPRKRILADVGSWLPSSWP